MRRNSDVIEESGPEMSCCSSRAAAELAGLEDGAAWARPAPATDKLYMSLGGGDMIEVR